MRRNLAASSHKRFVAGRFFFFFKKWRNINNMSSRGSTIDLTFNIVYSKTMTVAKEPWSRENLDTLDAAG